MYTPALFKIEELPALHTFMQAHNFATLVTTEQGRPFATHLPVFLDPTQGSYGTLTAHLARANPQWQHFATATEVLMIFQGPHTYISPAWYTSEFSVPTWNYTAVHAYGIPVLIEEQVKIQRHLDELVQYHEAPRAQPWQMVWSERHVNLTKAIVVFEIEIKQLEGKAKLSQNRSLADQQGVVKGLYDSPHEHDHAVARLMASNLP